MPEESTESEYIPLESVSPAESPGLEIRTEGDGDKIPEGTVVIFPHFSVDDVILGRKPRVWSAMRISALKYSYVVYAQEREPEEIVLLVESLGNPYLLLDFEPDLMKLVRKHVLVDWWKGPGKTTLEDRPTHPRENPETRF